MKSPVRFMARGLAEGGGEEKPNTPLVILRSRALAWRLEGSAACARGPSFEARRSTRCKALLGEHLRMTAVHGAVAQVATDAAALATRPRCARQSTSRPALRRCPRRS